MKIYPVGAKLLHADGQKDTQAGVTKLIVAFRSFAKVCNERCLKFCVESKVDLYVPRRFSEELVLAQEERLCQPVMEDATVNGLFLAE
jgi:hypothetical protein